MSTLENNTAGLQEILNAVNELPSGGGGGLPADAFIPKYVTFTDRASAYAFLQENFQKVTQTIARFSGAQWNMNVLSFDDGDGGFLYSLVSHRVFVNRGDNTQVEHRLTQLDLYKDKSIYYSNSNYGVDLDTLSLVERDVSTVQTVPDAAWPMLNASVTFIYTD